MRSVVFGAMAAATLLGGCVSTAVGVVKAPFQAAGQVVDWTTTSQDEADRNYGRKMREREAREGRERKKWEKECRKHPDGCGSYDGYRADADR
jgi:osmotically-inducible protein OsmY